jgi:hypothetical protein
MDTNVRSPCHDDVVDTAPARRAPAREATRWVGQARQCGMLGASLRSQAGEQASDQPPDPLAAKDAG